MPNSNDNVLDADEIARLTAEFEKANAAEADITTDPFAGMPFADSPVEYNRLSEPSISHGVTDNAVRPFGPSAVSVSPVQFSSLTPQSASGDSTLDLLLDVQLQVSVELGRARLPIKDLLALAPGAVIELDKLAGEPIDMLVNGTLVAHGEVVVVDEKFGVRVTEVVSSSKRLAAVG